MTSVSWVWNSDKGSTEVAYWIRNVQDVLLAGVRSSESAALCCSPKAPQWSALYICCRHVYVLEEAWSCMHDRTAVGAATKLVAFRFKLRYLPTSCALPSSWANNATSD
jgi:hypothetical protein